MPEILTVEGAGIRHAINGLLSLTPDGMPILGETPEVKNLWSVAAVWIKEGPGIARAVAEWAVEGASEIDVHGADIARFHPGQREQRHVDARASEGFNKTYGIVHPSEQWESNRNVRVSPFHPREQELGAVFFETAGWERPWWYESNATLLEEYGDRVMPREAEWESRWWSPIVNAEHLAMRDRVAMIDLTAFHILDVTGPGALEALQQIALAELDVEPGRVVYTPILDHNGGFKADLTIMRLGPELFRIVTGAAHGMARPEVVLGPAAAGRLGAARRRDRGLVHRRRLGAAGARPRRLGDERRRLARGLSVRALPRGRAGRRARAGLPDLLRRRARLGALRADGRRGRALGRPLGGGPAARRRAGRASASTGRPGGSRRATALYGAELESEYNVAEAGMTRAEGEGARLRRQGRVPAPPRGGAGRDHVHPDASTIRRRRRASSATCSGASRS